MAKVSFFIIKTEKMKNIEYILNDCLNKAMCQKNRIQKPNSNNIADFVSKYLQTEKLTLTDVVSCVCKMPEPRLKVSENGTHAYCNNCAKTYLQK